MNKLLKRYSQDYKVRYTRNQKNKAIKAIKEDMLALGYECEEIKQSKFGLFKTIDYFFGDLKQAQYVFVVPYDTLDFKFSRKVEYYPMNGQLNTSKNMKATYLPMIFFYVLILIGVYGTTMVTSNQTILMIVNYLMLLCMAILLYMMLHGFACRHNTNRNSASIALSIALAQAIDKGKRSKVAFVFTDKNKMDYKGNKLFQEKLEENNRNPLMIILDCLGKGSETRICYLGGLRNEATRLANNFKYNDEKITLVKGDGEKLLQTGLAPFKKAMMISSGYVNEEQQLWVKDTCNGKDKEIDEARLTSILEMLKHVA